MLLERKVSPKVVQELLGHEDIETTLRTYSHVLQEVYEGAAETLGEIHADMVAGFSKAASRHAAQLTTEAPRIKPLPDDSHDADDRSGALHAEAIAEYIKSAPRHVAQQIADILAVNL